MTTPATSTIAVETSGLTRRYAGIDVVRAVDLAIPAGRKVAVVGSNGAGKTTLLGMLCALVQPTRGEVRLEGHTFAGGTAARRTLGVLRHSPMVYEALSPLENLEFFARLYGVADPAARIETLLRTVGLWQRRHEPTAVFSRGYHQRLAIARALVHQPSILVIDEPETGLDAEGMALLDELMLRAPGVTVLAATHRLDRVASWADGVVRLERGRVVEDTASANHPTAPASRTAGGR